MVPFTMDSLPRMGSIQCAMQEKMMRSDSPSRAIGLRIPRWHAKSSCLGVVTKIGVEGAVLLASHQDVLNAISNPLWFGHNRWRVSGTVIEKQATSHQPPEFPLHAPAPLPRLNP